MGQTIKADFSRKPGPSGPTLGLKLALVGLFIFSLVSFYFWISVFRAPVKVEQYASAEAITAAASGNSCVAQELKTRLGSETPVLATELSDMQDRCDIIQKKRALAQTQSQALQGVISASAK